MSNCSTTLTTIPDEYFSKVDMVMVEAVLDQIERIISGKRLMLARDDEEDSSNPGYDDDIISVSTPARRTSSTRPDESNEDMDNIEDDHIAVNNKDCIYSDRRSRLGSVEESFHRPFVDEHYDKLMSSLPVEGASNSNSGDEMDDPRDDDDEDDGWDSDPYEWEEEQEVYKVRFQDILDALHTLSDYHLAQLVNRVANIRPHLLQNHPLSHSKLRTWNFATCLLDDCLTILDITNFKLLEEHRATEHLSDLRREGCSTFDDDIIQDGDNDSIPPGATTSAPSSC